jgi:hypothetical protein
MGRRRSPMLQWLAFGTRRLKQRRQ